MTPHPAGINATVPPTDATQWVPVAVQQSAKLVEIVDEVGPVEDADIRYEIAEIAGVRDVHHVGALADHLVYIAPAAELLAWEKLNHHAAVGTGGDVLREELRRLVRRLDGRRLWAKRMRMADCACARAGAAKVAANAARRVMCIMALPDLASRYVALIVAPSCPSFAAPE
jgi:hypothetical protein